MLRKHPEPYPALSRTRILEENTINNTFRQFRFSDKYKYCYVNIPKCACSSIKRSLWAHEDMAYRDEDLHNIDASPFAFVPTVKPEKYLFFTFVRNPTYRILSFYLDKIVRKKDKFIYPCFLQTYKLRDKSFSFREILDVLGDVDPIEMESHWAPQTSIMNLDNVRYDLIGRLETFESDWARICQSIGLEDASILTHAPHAQHAQERSTPHLDERTLAKIYDVFKADFESLCYDPEGGSGFKNLDGMGEHNLDYFNMVCQAIADPDFALQYVRLERTEKALQLSF
jgi:hypothetical protein